MIMLEDPSGKQVRLYFTKDKPAGWMTLQKANGAGLVRYDFTSRQEVLWLRDKLNALEIHMRNNPS